MIEIIEVVPYRKRFLVRLQPQMEILLNAREIKKYQCVQGNILNERQWEELCRHLFVRGRERALYLLDRSEQTEKQIKDKLVAGFYPATIIEQVIEYLKEYHCIDDYRFTCNYIENKKNKKSRKQITQELYQKGISKENIENAFDESDYSPMDSLMKLVEKKASRYDLNEYKELAKFYQYLLGKGYPYDAVDSVIKRLKEGCDLNNEEY
ncbi:MAG: recombination regulator RecX [Eubacterium sp.]|nr:recombination regulator RecX [Eubacterium sp.]